MGDGEWMGFVVRGQGGTRSRWVFGIYGLKLLREVAAWTVTHGHFLIMGGFHVVEPPEVPDGSIRSTDTQAAPTRDLVEETDTETGRGSSEKKCKGRVTILTLELLRKLVKDPDFEIQTTQEEITDKSKGDALSKLIFILQSTWFILQCVGRRVQGINLTHLELTTLALASLNGITFILWWDKPLGAQAVVRVHLKRNLTDSERVPREVSNIFRVHVLFDKLLGSFSAVRCLSSILQSLQFCLS